MHKQIPCWCPFAARAPWTDSEHFEALSAAVFSARFSVEIVRKRWPSIRAVFAGFDLRTVASWPDSEVDRLLAYPGMIRNRKKIMAVVRNARDLLVRVEEYGSVRGYLDSFRGDTAALIESLDTWAHYIGAPSIRCYLRCAGYLRDTEEG